MCTNHASPVLIFSFTLLVFLSFPSLSSVRFLRNISVYVCTSLLSRNLHKEAKFEGSTSTGAKEEASTSTRSTSDSSEHVPPVAPSPEAAAEVASRTTILTPMALSMFGSRDSKPAAAESSGAKDDVQGLTQMYYLEEEAEEEAVAAAAAATSAAVASSSPAAVGVVAPVAAFTTASHGSSSRRAAAAEAVPMSAEPQGLTQVFFLDPEMEAEAAAALPVVPGRSFLRERLGVPGEVVQDLRQVGWMGDAGGG